MVQLRGRARAADAGEKSRLANFARRTKGQRPRDRAQRAATARLLSPRIGNEAARYRETMIGKSSANCRVCGAFCTKRLIVTHKPAVADSFDESRVKKSRKLNSSRYSIGASYETAN